MVPCQLCGSHAPTRNVMLMQNVGLIVLRFPKQISGMLCRRCVDENFWPMTLITLFFGWWGVFSFFYSLVSIPMNIAAFIRTRSLPPG